MMSKGMLLFGVVALAACAGCASGPRYGGDAAGPASPSSVQAPIQRCSGGVYNRAAGLCVSEGP